MPLQQLAYKSNIGIGDSSHVLYFIKNIFRRSPFFPHSICDGQGGGTGDALRAMNEHASLRGAVDKVENVIKYRYDIFSGYVCKVLVQWLDRELWFRGKGDVGWQDSLPCK